MESEDFLDFPLISWSAKLCSLLLSVLVSTVTCCPPLSALVYSELNPDVVIETPGLNCSVLTAIDSVSCLC
jgi:hypothetical protein